jgi:hypothetical protein
MSKNSERVKLWMGEDWFGELMWILQDLRQHFQYQIEAREAEQDQEGAEGYRQDLRENIQLVNKIIKYGWYEEKAEGRNEARVEFFASEARDLIWQLILFSVLHTPKNAGASLYKEYKRKHESYIAGELTVPNELSNAAARELIQAEALGGVYLVKNKDGKCYIVDHGFTELVKTDDHWEDKEYGFDENVFGKTKYSYDIVSWEDEKPLNIFDYLKENGWVRL